MTILSEVSRKYLILSVIFSITATVPLLHQNFPDVEEGVAPVFRLVELDLCLKDGVLFPRWFPDLYGGRGGLFFNFYPPLSYYISEFFHLIGFGFADSIKATFAISIVLSAISMYLFAREIVGEPQAFIASVLYVYAPYHLGDIYLRGVLAESFVFVLIPLTLFSFHRLIKEKSDKFLIMSSLLYGTIILTHTISAMIFTAFLLVYLSFFKYHEKNFPLKKVGAAFFFGMCLTAFFWFPALIEKIYVDIEKVHFLDYHASFISINWLIHSFSFLKTNVVENPYIILQVGFFQTLLIPIALLYSRNRFTLFIFSLFIASLFFMTRFSAPFWETIPLMQYIQFPWRIFIITALLSSLLGGIAFSSILKDDYKGITLSLLVSIIIVISALNVIQVPGYVYAEKVATPHTIRSWIDYYGGLTAKNEYFPKGAVIPNTTIKSRVDVLSGGADILITEEKCNLLEFKTDAKEASILRINTFYFPGWTVYVDGNKEDVRVDRNGLMELYVEKGVHEIKVKFENTRVRTIATFVSMLTLVFLIVLIIYALTYRRYSNDSKR